MRGALIHTAALVHVTYTPILIVAFGYVPSARIKLLFIAIFRKKRATEGGGDGFSGRASSFYGAACKKKTN